MKRFFALIAAVAMICVAVIIRSGIDSGGSGTKPSSGPITIACVTELADECNKLRNVTVRVEDASVTAKAIANGTAHIDGWVTFDPWPEIADKLANNNVTGKSARVAASPLVIAMVQERADAFAPSCGGTVTWHCLGDAIGKQWTEVGGRPEWGAVKAGISPVKSALGLLMLGNAAATYFGRTDFATNDFDDPFTVWKAKVTATVATFDQFIVQFPALFSAVGTTKRELDGGKGAKAVAQIVPNPSASAIVMITSVDSERALGLESDLTKELKGQGWGDALPQASGLPDPGVLLALSGLTR